MRFNSKRISTIVFESVLIIFSVLLALFLSELRNIQKEEALKEKALLNIRSELANNQLILGDRLKTHIEIRDNVRDLLKSGITPIITDSLFSGELGFDIFYFTSSGSIAPELLKDAAWNAAQNANIISTFPYEIILAVSNAYDSQNLVEFRIIELVKFILTDRETLDKDQINKTLIILRDYFSELVANEEYLNIQYELALEEMDKRTDE
ncbi:hypothetical protein [Catalinimonas niigatensis]|uniref:hypothetical protein n=1 Tax=Catalinimonas niigatensis TaxID=1397264 RepID=UPI002667160C|nr:hypothetical protein [Catalinimonas niigatensis]WPP51294.1 hypothetical protein PZB72_02680 [Catalinimonas niigatensis]